MKSFSKETAERYSLALFELASENSELDAIEKNIGEILELFEINHDLYNFLRNPTISTDKQEKMITKISDIMQINEIMKNFMLLLIKKKRIFFVKNILKHFLILSSKKRGVVSAELISSKKLENDKINILSEEFSKIIGSKIKFDFKVDQSLIGGLKVKIGSTLIDSSLKSKLKKYENLIIEN
tara:strand:- start:1485 stop:2033 length:549 start_codon:yes stop_codon:yes gene_type:complete